MPPADWEPLLRTTPSLATCSPHTLGSHPQVSLELVLRPSVTGCLIARTPSHPRSRIWGAEA